MPAWISHVPWWVIAAAALVLVVAVIAGLRAVLARRTPRAATGSGLHNGYLVATVLIAAAALTLILVAFTMSYAALYESATWLADTQLTAINGGDLRFLFPLGIDAVIVYFLAMDLVMEWQGRRHPLNRWSAYGLSAITIVLNVSQGEGTTSSYLGHAGPPVVIILIAEGVAAWVRHLAGLAHGGAADRIPAGRWIAHPLSTLKVARLMLGSGITSYPDALEREQQRQLAYAMLREQYARRWRRATPRHLKWMLDNGYDLATAFRIIRAMTASRVAMTAEEARALLGEPGPAPAPPAPGPAATGAAAEPTRWRAAAIPEVEAADGRARNGRRPANGATNGAAGGRRGPVGRDAGPQRDTGAAPEHPPADGHVPADPHGERGYTPVLFQEPGPASGGGAAPETAPDAADDPAYAEAERATGPDAGERTSHAAAEPRADESGAPAAPRRGSAEPQRAAANGSVPSLVPPAAPGAVAETGPETEAEPALSDAPDPAPRPAGEQAPGPTPETLSEPAEPATEPATRRTAPPLSRPTSKERRQQVRQLLESIPDITEEEIAGHLGVTPRTARRYRNEILDTASGSGDYRIEEGEDGQPRLVQTAYGD